MMKKFIRVMKALSDPNRVRIIKLLQNGPHCVNDLQKMICVAQSTTSKHLKILESAGLVMFYKKGNFVYYKIADGTESPYAATMLGSLKHWLSEVAKSI